MSTETTSPEPTASEPVTPEEILRRAQDLHEKIRGWRREIHRHPELSFTEHRTSGLVNATMVDLGIETETEVAKTGVVGHISGGAGPTVGLRADMDALPIQEINGSDFDSTRPGIMHACGHDSHTAMLMGAATILKQFADEGRLPGSVRLLFQPSEEAQDDEHKSGGMRMVEEGALEGLDAVFGIHVDFRADTGHVGTRPGPMLAAADRFEISVNGSGTHAASPHTGVDPILLAAQVVQAIHHIVSRRLNPIETGVITIGTIHGGTANNVIPHSVTMEGTIRAFTEESRELLRTELRKACSVAEALGGSFDLTIYPGYPPTVLDPEAAAITTAATRDLFGEEMVYETEPVMAAEDFSYMAQAATGGFINLGVHDPAWGDEYYPVHRADFRMDENALPVGTASLVATAIRWMQEKR